jgi:membrane protein
MIAAAVAPPLFMVFTSSIRALPGVLRDFPWRQALRDLRLRLREDRLSMTAGSLTFTTTLALVPLLAVVLAVFTAFPVFGKLQASLQQWLADSLVPPGIARQVSGYLTQFASKASRLGWVGLGALAATALMQVLTIDRSLNAIWGVRERRPFLRSVLIYTVALTLGPLLLALSLAMTSYAVSASRGLVGALPAGVRGVFDLVDFAIAALGIAALYRFVPLAPVDSRHALAGGVIASLGLELSKAGLGLYLTLVPSYSVIYGAFASVPILLLWIYLVWMVLLLAAVVVAQLPAWLPRSGAFTPARTVR